MFQLFAIFAQIKMQNMLNVFFNYFESKNLVFNNIIKQLLLYHNKKCFIVYILFFNDFKEILKIVIFFNFYFSYKYIIGFNFFS